MNLILGPVVQRPLRRPKEARPNLVLSPHDPSRLAAVMVGDCYLSEYLHDPAMPLMLPLAAAIRQASLLPRTAQDVRICVYDEHGGELEILHASNRFLGGL